MLRNRVPAYAALACALLAGAAADQLSPRDAMLKAAAYFRSIATEGGYLWRYSLDLKERAGETPATDTQIWVQPPGTPAVGQAYLRAWRATGDRRFLEAAVAAAHALVRGQLESGGWDYRVEFDPGFRSRWNYRGAATGGRNVSTLDDDNTQSALRLLMDVHAASPEPALKGAIDYGLTALLKAQYPNGAFPQRFPPTNDYGAYYTFNDNTIADPVCPSRSMSSPTDRGIARTVPDNACYAARSPTSALDSPTTSSSTASSLPRRSSTPPTPWG